MIQVPATESRFDCAPEAALAAIASHDGLLLADLDETLYLRNSTEDFIDSAVPGLLALMLMKILELVKPWRWSGGHATRDVWRTGLICIVLPWTKLIWRRRVQKRAAKFGNQPLLAAIRARQAETVIATVGFSDIVQPLIAAMGLTDTRIVSSRMYSFHDRLAGKSRLLTAALGADAVRHAMIVTDSVDDFDLLSACAKPLRVIWPTAQYRTALSRIYLPIEYLARVKRPGERYFIRGVLQEDFAYWLLTSLVLTATPLMHAAGLLLLLISFWAVYERGYVDNDLVASQFEAEPKLSVEFYRNPVATPILQPWLWAAAFGAAAIFVLRFPGDPQAVDFYKWAAVLVATYIWFKLYNRVDKRTRVWMFPVLQMARTAAFVALVPVSLVGAAALAAHLFSRWVPYYVYRFGGRNWPETQPALIRLTFFILIASLFAISQGLNSVLNYTGLALLAWTVFRAHRDIRSLCRSLQRIDRHLP